MSRIRDAFKNGKAFIPFVTGGDPDLETTEKLVIAMAKAGADVIEIGLAFSDPVAEGLVIQAASKRALDAGTTTDKLFDSIKNIRKEVDTPLIIMTYINPVYAYGFEKFFTKCKEVGVDGIIVPDIPYEEKHEVSDVCEKYGVDFISMVAPTSNDRIKTICSEATGFIYCVSSLGVTGVRSEFTANLSGMVETIRSVTDVPVAIGFGISSPEQAKEMAMISDGAIIGSAIVKIVEKYGRDAVAPVAEFVKSVKEAVRS